MKDNTVYWKQLNGELISIDDMDINHLRNVLKMIVRNSNKQKALTKKKDFKLNGDMANEFNNSHPSDEDDYDDDNNEQNF